MSCTLFGRKLFVIADPGPASQFLAQSVNCLGNILDLINQGPDDFHNQMYAVFTKPESLIVQLSGAAHAVLTVDFPALVTGFEAGRPNDGSRYVKFESNYAVVIGVSMQILLNQRSPPTRRKIASKLNCDAGDVVVRKIDESYERKKKPYVFRKKFRALSRI